MKNLLLNLVLLISTAPALSHVTNEAIPELTSLDCFYLRGLYNIADTVTDFEKIENLNFNYYLDLLERQIKIIQYKINTKASKWSDKDLQGDIIILSLFTVGIAGVLSLICHDWYTGTFAGVNIPYFMLKELPSLAFSQAEKAKLDLFDVKTITITYEKPKYGFMTEWEELRIRGELSNLSPENREKLNYLARQTAIDNTKMLAVITSLLWLIMVPVSLFKPIREAIYYQENLRKQLAYTENLYQRLLNAKINRANRHSVTHNQNESIS